MGGAVDFLLFYYKLNKAKNYNRVRSMVVFEDSSVLFGSPKNLRGATGTFWAKEHYRHLETEIMVPNISNVISWVYIISYTVNFPLQP